MFRVVACFLVFVCAVGAAESVGAQSRAARDSAQAEVGSRVPGLVKIWVNCPGSAAEGAGVLVSDSGHVLTAGHVGLGCIGATADIRIGRATGVYGVPARTHRADVIARMSDGKANPTSAQAGFTRRQDIALFKVRSGQPTLGPPARISRSLPLPGDLIRVAGFSNLPFAVADSASSAGISVFQTSLASVAADTADTPLRLHYGGGSWQGMSGGPVYNDQNEVIGIHSARAMRDVENLLNENCNPRVQGCFGNAIAFDIPRPGGGTRTQLVNIPFDSVRAILENFSWATSVHAIPGTWQIP